MPPASVLRVVYVVAGLVCVFGNSVIHIEEENWRQLLTKEWMVEL
ncbi:unnamed protein product [Soboliphyme baturini]|uniref:Col_cuticle_N domain-containing protein n=1 Tax=Soboliphyme baturini TaxID=241478 RepID=A0A183JAD7_9BILA|nr:unnamed protein product [Soboliphyme baturini]